MAKFTTTGNHNGELKNIELPNKESKRLHLVGVRARVSSDITLVSSNNITATLKASPYDGPNGIWVVDIKGSVNGEGKLEAKFNDTVVATTKVKVFKKVLVALPLDSTVEGMLAKLFLCESINPGKELTYNAKNSKTSMLWMRQVINNRMAHALKYKQPYRFNIAAKTGHQYTIYDVVKAKKQFEGFEAFPKLHSNQQVNINGILAISNNYNRSDRELYASFVNNAVNAASKDALKGFLDPCPTGLYGWRTKGSKHPGGDYVIYKDIGGQTFYTLK